MKEKTLHDEAQDVLDKLDHLAEVWGDEGVFRRCRDQLRDALKKWDENGSFNGFKIETDRPDENYWKQNK